MEMVNGYVFLDLTKANVYAKALKVLGADKPVVIKEGSNAPYFVDSLTLDGTSVVITKGGKTITIAKDNTITNVGDIQNHLYNNSVFIKGVDENEVNIYIYFTITSTKEMTLNDVKDYIENNFTSTETYLQANGYDADNYKTIVGIIFYNNKYMYENSNDETNTFTITDEECKITSIQIY